MSKGQKLWTPAEVEYLRANRNKRSSVLAQEMGRTAGSVKRAINRLGLQRDHETVFRLMKEGIAVNAERNRGCTGERNPNWKGGIAKNHMHYKRLQEQRYPERCAARRAAYQAVRRGEIQKRACQYCGATKAHMHHDDYSKPLDVRWLCRPCHLAEHNGIWNSNPQQEAA